MADLIRKKVIVFGLGKIFKIFLEWYDESKISIVALSDNNVSLHGTEMCGIKVVNPINLNSIQYDYIVVASSYFDRIREQLIDLGVNENSILNFNEIYQKSIIKDTRSLDILRQAPPLQTNYSQDLRRLEDLTQKQLFLSARNFIGANCNKNINALEDIEFQVFSQFGEDGIIQWLIHNVDIENKTFIEFGVEDYSESNTRFLLMNNNWSGFVMDGSKDNMDRLMSWESWWKYDLQCKAAFITKDNINQLILEAGFSGDLGILSIDLDGNDYWILNTIDCVQPRILICEYNNVYGQDEMVSVPYDPEFVRTKKHYSNLYWGVSIAALRDWADRNGYYYMGSNSAGNNAFFVRKDCISKDKIPNNSKIFVESKYRESRDENGRLSYLQGSEKLECIKDMELYNFKSNSVEKIKDIYNI